MAVEVTFMEKNDSDLNFTQMISLEEKGVPTWFLAAL
jgi:hypothetical protein